MFCFVCFLPSTAVVIHFLSLRRWQGRPANFPRPKRSGVRRVHSLFSLPGRLGEEDDSKCPAPRSSCDNRCWRWVRVQTAKWATKPRSKFSRKHAIFFHLPFFCFFFSKESLFFKLTWSGVVRKLDVPQSQPYFGECRGEQV